MGTGEHQLRLSLMPRLFAHSGEQERPTRDGRLHMMFKLGRCAEKTWRRLWGFKELEKVIKGIHFMEGIEETRFDPVAA